MNETRASENFFCCGTFCFKILEFNSCYYKLLFLSATEPLNRLYQIKQLIIFHNFSLKCFTIRFISLFYFII